MKRNLRAKVNFPGGATYTNTVAALGNVPHVSTWRASPVRQTGPVRHGSASDHGRDRGRGRHVPPAHERGLRRGPEVERVQAGPLRDDDGAAGQPASPRRRVKATLSLAAVCMLAGCQGSDPTLATTPPPSNSHAAVQSSSEYRAGFRVGDQAGRSVINAYRDGGASDYRLARKAHVDAECRRLFLWAAHADRVSVSPDGDERFAAGCVDGVRSVNPGAW